MFVRKALVLGVVVAGIGGFWAFAADPPQPAEKTANGFRIHHTAPEEVSDVYQTYEKGFGMVPNMAKVMAGSPALARSYFDVQQNIKKYSSLSPAEINIVQLALAVENRCEYCTAGHTMAGKMVFKTPMEQMQCVRKNQPLEDAKLETLRQFALRVYEKRGEVGKEELRKFLEAGYTREQALDVVACIAAKVLSNYTNALAETPLDEPLQGLAEGLHFSE